MIKVVGEPPKGSTCGSFGGRQIRIYTPVTPAARGGGVGINESADRLLLSTAKAQAPAGQPQGQ